MGFGALGTVLEDMEYNHVLSNPIPETAARVIGALGALLLVAGITALQRAQRDRAGRLGRNAYVVTVAGFVLAATGEWPLAPLGLLLFVVGSTAFGIASVRGGVLPRAAVWLLAVGTPLSFVAGPVVEVFAFGGHQGWGPWAPVGVVVVAYAWLGVWLWTRGTFERAEAHAVRT